MKRRPVRIAAGWLVAALASGTLAAQQAPPVNPQGEPDTERKSGSTIDVEASAFRTDNALRTSTDKLEDTIYMLGTQASLRHDGPIFDGSLDADFDYVTYDKANYDARVLGFFNGVASASTRSGGFRWDLRESFGQLRRNAYAAETVENFEDVNYLTTGPVLTLNLGSNTQLTSFAEYSNSSNENSALDSDQWSAGLSLKQGASPDAGLSVHLIGERNEFGDAAPAGSDFDSYVGFVRWQARTARTRLSIDGGYARVESDLTRDEAPLVRIVAQRTLGASTRMYLNADQEFSTAAGALRRSAEDRVKFGITQPTRFSYLATSDAFLSRYAEAGFNFDKRRTRFTVSVTWNQERYVNTSSLDRDGQGIYAAVARQVRPTLSLRLEGAWRNEKFLQGGSNADEQYAQFDIVKNLGPRTELDFSYQLTERSDSDNSASDFDEHRYGIYLRHRLLDRR